MHDLEVIVANDEQLVWELYFAVECLENGPNR